MRDVMMIGNVSYALFECDAPFFMLKSEILQAMEQAKPVAVASSKPCMVFEGKYYGYYKLNPPPKPDEGIVGEQKQDKV